MEWWHIFGILFVVFFTIMLIVSFTKSKESGMSNQEWKHPGAKEEEQDAGKTKVNTSMQSVENENFALEKTDDLDENFVTRGLKNWNKRKNLRGQKKNLKEAVEIGELQVKHVTNANEFVSQKNQLENQQKQHELNTLNIDIEIAQKKEEQEDSESLRQMRHRAKQLELELQIAKQEEELKRIQNPPRESSPAPKLTLKQEIDLLRVKIKDEENLKKAKEYEILQGRDPADLPEDQQEEVLRVQNNHNEILQKMYRRMNELRSKAI